MRRLVAGASVSVVALIALLAGPALAEEPDRGAVSGYCAAHRDFGLTHGACVALLQTRNIVPHDASVCRDEGIRGFLGVANHGQCVKRLAELRR